MKHATQWSPAAAPLGDYLTQPFDVWSVDDRFGVLSTIVVASFRYLLEAIDYCQGQAERGADTVLRSTLTATVIISHYGPTTEAQGAA